jgi:hypothetical protein
MLRKVRKKEKKEHTTQKGSRCVRISSPFCRSSRSHPSSSSRRRLCACAVGGTVAVTVAAAVVVVVDVEIDVCLV